MFKPAVKKNRFLSFLIIVFSVSTIQAINTSLPTSGFKENKGQVLNQFQQPNTDVLFLYSAKGLNIQLRKNGFSYDVFGADAQTPFQPGKKAIAIQQLEAITYHHHRVDIDFVNNKANCLVEAQNELPGFDNFYLNGKSNEGVKSFATVLYKNVFPNTDIEFVINPDSKNAFKYNIILHPGADLKNVNFLVQGAEKVSLSPPGNLQMLTSLGTLDEKIPLSYYAQKPGENIAVQYTLNNNTFSFKANYDNTQTLIIDPATNLIWASYYGSTDTEYYNANGMDAQNNLHIAGYTNSTANIATNGVYQSTLAAGFDAYVIKFNSNGQRLWGTYLGAGGVDVFYAIYVEPNGTMYLCGDTSSQTNLTSLGAFQTVFGGGIDDVLLSKFNNAGQLLWCTYLGGPKHDIAQAITEDSNGNVIITGHTESTVGIATPGAYSTQYTLNYDVFMAKFSPLGAQLWGTYYGDSGVDEAYGIACDASNNIIITGVSASISGISTPAAHQVFFGGYQDAFISKFNSAGTNLIWATYYGEQGSDFGNDVEVDNAGNIFVVGITTSTASIATAGAYQTIQGSNDDSFVAAFTPAGVRLWGTYFGGDDTDYITDLLIDANKNLVFCGSTQSSYSISTVGAWQPSLAAIYYYDAYFAKFSPTGQKKLATYFGGDANDNAKAISIDSFGKVYLSGETTSTVGIATSGVHQNTLAGNSDAFIAKFCLPLEPKLSPSGTKTVCTGNFTLSATPGYSNYLWNGTFTGNPLVLNFSTAPATFTYALHANDGFGCSGTSDTTKLIIDKCVGLKESENDWSLSVYPNPTQHSVHIELQNQSTAGSDIEIYSVAGQLLARIENSNETPIVNLSELPAGLYLLRIKTSSGKRDVKIVKE